jgi:hypothetical protein
MIILLIILNIMGCGDSRIGDPNDKKKSEKESKDQALKESNKKSAAVQKRNSIVPKPIIRGFPCNLPVMEVLKDPNDYNLIKSVYYGMLDEFTDFLDCMIRSEVELVVKLKYKVAMKDAVDEIFSKTNFIDWENYFLIAVRGAYIEHVKWQDGTYIIMPTENEKVEIDEYCAAVVDKKFEEKEKEYHWKWGQLPTRNLEVIKKNYRRLSIDPRVISRYENMVTEPDKNTQEC